MAPSPRFSSTNGDFPRKRILIDPADLFYLLSFSFFPFPFFLSSFYSLLSFVWKFLPEKLSSRYENKRIWEIGGRPLCKIRDRRSKRRKLKAPSLLSRRVWPFIDVFGPYSFIFESSLFLSSLGSIRDGHMHPQASTTMFGNVFCVIVLFEST